MAKQAYTAKFKKLPVKRIKDGQSSVRFARNSG